MKGFYVAEALFFISVFVFVVTLVIIWPYLFGPEIKEGKQIPSKSGRNKLRIRLRYALKRIRDYYKQARGKTDLIWVS